MIDLKRLMKMRHALPFALDARLPADARSEIHQAFDELIACRLRVDAAIAECEEVQEDTLNMPGERIAYEIARRIHAKLEGTDKQKEGT